MINKNLDSTDDVKFLSLSLLVGVGEKTAFYLFYIYIFFVLLFSLDTPKLRFQKCSKQ